MEYYFRTNVMPLLSPQIIGKKHPFPFLNNQEIYAVALSFKQKQRKNMYCTM